VYEALETLEKQMLKEDRVPPTQYVFTVLIGVLGRVGYTEKAFSVFDKVCSLILLNFKTVNQKHHPEGIAMLARYIVASSP